jgi:hypothetical protein
MLAVCRAGKINSERAMWRWTIPFLIAIAAIGTASGANRTLAPHGLHRAAGKLPAGLPRPHYHFRTTVSYGAPYTYRRYYALPVAVDEEPDLLFTPTDAFVPYILPLVGVPLLPGSSTLPGYYGWSHSYYYQGPYYGGPYVSYWNRLPYACGVYGYC